MSNVSQRSQVLRDQRVLFLAICFLIPSVWLYVVLSDRQTLPKLKMTAGVANGLRHQLALELARELGKKGIPVEVIPTEGSAKAIEQISTNAIDLALVQGGLSTTGYENVRQLTPLHIEPLHLLVKPEIHEEVANGNLTHLAGRTVNLGSIGSGTQLLVQEVLHFAALKVSNTPVDNACIADDRSQIDLRIASYESLPDAVFTVSTLPSTLADFLIDVHGFKLVPIPFSDALSLQAFMDFGKELPKNTICKHNLFATKIPAWTYSIQRREPALDLPTLGTRLLLVGHHSLPNPIVAKILDTLYRSELIKAEKPPIDASLLDQTPEYILHMGSEQYRQRNKPLIAGDFIDYLEKILAISATVFGGLLFAGQIYLRNARQQRETRLTHYMERVLTIEKDLLDSESAARLELPKLLELQRELADLKSDAIKRFASGELHGETMIQGFLALVNDARNQLTRLILHERENIEQRAIEQNASPETLWNQQMKMGCDDIDIG